MAAHRSLALISLVLLGATLVVAPSSTALAGEEVTVEITAQRFSPDPVEIRTGTTVVWKNKEPLDYPVLGGVHELAADDGSFASDPFAPSASWDHRFLLPGTFAYHCARHSLMTGKIIVTGPPIIERLTKNVSIAEGSASDPNTWGFRPPDLTVDVGTIVVWRNNGTQQHTVTADDSSFDTTVDAGGSWKRTFDHAGVFRYHCTPHPWMTAVVRVAAPGQKPPVEQPRPAPAPGAGTTHTTSGGAAVHRARAATGRGPAVLDVRVVERSASDINSWGFDPPALQIRAGDTVRWRNTGSMQHTITSDDGSSFDAGYVAPGAVWERRFAAVGTFRYHCAPHPWMKATITVVKADAPQATVSTGAVSGVGPGSALAVIPPIVHAPSVSSPSTPDGTPAPAGRSSTGEGIPGWVLVLPLIAWAGATSSWTARRFVARRVAARPGG